MSPPDADEVVGGGEGPADIIADPDQEEAALEAAAREFIAAREKGEPIPRDVMQRLFASWIKLYAVEFQSGERWWPFQERRAMPATAVMILCNAMLRAIQSETFELAIWQAFSGNVAPPQSDDL